MSDLARRVLDGDLRAAARVMRLVDDRAPQHVPILKELFPHLGRAYVVGITGTPGAGKSTLVDRLIEVYRKDAKKVGVVAVDPTSPYSGGSILGDRIRMQRHFLDDQVFIRSVATRGALGGLSRSAGDIISVLDAFGCDVILAETVGVGQDELEVTRLAHTTVVVVPPGGGDDVQANKAGIMEIADIFVVNKADREGADAQVRHLESMIALGREIAAGGARAGGKVQGFGHGHGHGHGRAFHSSAESMGVDLVGVGDAAAGGRGGWATPVLKTISSKGEGVAALADAIVRHRAFLETPEGRGRREAQKRDQLITLFRDVLTDAARQTLGAEIDDAAAAVARGDLDRYTACEELLVKFRAGGPK